MSNPLPLCQGMYYHIYNRGVNRENIFFEARNYPYFLALYQYHIEPIAETFAFCLLRNHFHILVRIKTQAECSDLAVKPPSRKFSDFFNAYAKAINKAYQRTGSLFQRPFGRVPITTDRQYLRVIAYIHQNPQKHRLTDDFRTWPYSSYGIITSENPTFVQREGVLAWYGSIDQYRASHEAWVTDTQSKGFAEGDVS